MSAFWDRAADHPAALSLESKFAIADAREIDKHFSHPWFDLRPACGLVDTALGF
jgi:hypothetical protein